MTGRARSGAGRRAAVTIVVVLASILQGCGGSSDQDQIRASLGSFYAALARHDAAGACREMTPAFWRAYLQDVAARLATQSAGQVPISDCRIGLRYLFSREGAASSSGPGYTVSNIHVQANAATATVLRGSARAHAGFVRGVGASWRIDCCAGAQVAQQPTTTYRIPSGSMEPTFKIGQTVTSDNTAMREHPPALNDIIVFHPPSGADGSLFMCGDKAEGVDYPQPCGVPTPGMSAETFIKRVVGLPGDRIAIVHGRVVRNGKLASEPFITPCQSAAGCEFPKPIVVPQGMFYVLGDNRGASDDSRFWGPIKRAWIVGLVKP